MSKAQHARAYQAVPRLLRDYRERADLTQRALGKRLRKPQSWVFNCESANRRVDVVEFMAWCDACGVDPSKALSTLRSRQEEWRR